MHDVPKSDGAFDLTTLLSSSSQDICLFCSFDFFWSFGHRLVFETSITEGDLTTAAGLVQGFFYNQYPAPNITDFDQRGTDTESNKNQELWYHVVGTSQDEDIFVLAIPEEPTYSIAAGYTTEKECVPLFLLYLLVII